MAYLTCLYHHYLLFLPHIQASDTLIKSEVFLVSLSQQTGLAGLVSWEVGHSPLSRYFHLSGSHQLFPDLKPYETLLTGNVWFQCCWQVSGAVVCTVEPEIPICTDVLGLPKQVSYLMQAVPDKQEDIYAKHRESYRIWSRLRYSLLVSKSLPNSKCHHIIVLRLNGELLLQYEICLIFRLGTEINFALLPFLLYLCQNSILLF